MTEEPIISKDTRVASDVEIGPFTVIHPGVEIMAGSVIGSHCVIGHPNPRSEQTLFIGHDSLVRSHSVLYAGSRFDDRLETGHHVTIREGTRAGHNLRVGTNSDIQGDCMLGHFVRLHSDVHIAKGASLGNMAWLSPRVQMTNDPLPPSTVQLETTLGPMVTVATGALLMPGIAIGFGAFVSAASVVRSDVDALSWVAGDPAKRVASIERLISFEHGLRYPWPHNFRQRFPDDAQPLIDELLQQFESLRRR